MNCKKYRVKKCHDGYGGIHWETQKKSWLFWTIVHESYRDCHSYPKRFRSEEEAVNALKVYSQQQKEFDAAIAKAKLEIKQKQFTCVE